MHAKTGTLTGAIALNGLTQGKDGRWKVFSFIENGSTAKNSAIKDAMGGLTATVNGCWAYRLLDLTRTCAPGRTFCVNASRRTLDTAVCGAMTRWQAGTAP